MFGKAANRIFELEGWSGVLKLVIFSLTFVVGLGILWLFITFGSRILVNEHQMSRLTDLGQVQLYHSANLALKPDTNRIVFLGDSIVRLWNISDSFHRPEYLNRGIDSQTSADMLIRYRQDVIDLQPSAVVILAGVNDFAEGYVNANRSGEEILANLEANDETMAELAEMHHIRPIFISLLPLHSYTSRARKTYLKVSPALIVAADRWLQMYCSQHHYLYINAFSAMVDQRGMMRKDLSDDGIHPNLAGYTVLTQRFAEAVRSKP